MSEIWKGFCVLEGIDGAGKTTAMELLQRKVIEEGLLADVFFTAEPTGRGRAMLEELRRNGEPLPATLAYLFAADRHEHLYGKGGVRERIGAGRRVICDRYLFSSLVYQGIAGGGETARRLNAGFPLPEILFLFDISAEEAGKRIAARGGKRSAFERQDFLRKAAREYRRVAAEFEGAGMRIVSIDARLPREEIAGIIWSEAWK